MQALECPRICADEGQAKAKRAQLLDLVALASVQQLRRAGKLTSESLCEAQRQLHAAIELDSQQAIKLS